MSSAAVIASLSLAVTACSGEAKTQSNDADKTQVVASTNVYGDLAERIGGKNAEVTSIITNAAQDPHSYQATARDKLTISKADLLVTNGGGYDTFADEISKDLGEEAPRQVTSFKEEGHDHVHDEHGENEHIWYNLDHTAEFAKEIANALGQADDENAKDYRSNAKKVEKQIRAVTESETYEAARKLGSGKTFMMTEPVPEALLQDLGMKNGTPEGLSEAVESEQEISPLIMKNAQQAIKAGKIDVFAFNSQTADAQTQKLLNQAKSAGVPVVDFTETLPENTNYTEWMSSNVASVKDALADS